ncbi:hypothetical protein Goarm_020223, partial [Gossypium armourianum]|nr:hypothetical protein [Gossypium klotzschianum]MBA0823494.1 hypothetical protein [Gossypium armourianum]
VLLLLLLTSARDPGIVPRNLHPPTEEICYDSSASIDVGRQTPTPRLPPTKEVIVNGVPVRVKYCITCQLYRPPRCSHCSVCDNCVERFDHHCPWVGQCIGMTTYETFRYRGVERPQVYDRGCLNNFREVFCSKIKPSRNNFHAYVQENERGFTRGMNSEGYIGNLDGNRREKVEDDREIGGDLLKISQRREAEDA